jgi:hypothetical protein
MPMHKMLIDYGLLAGWLVLQSAICYLRSALGHLSLTVNRGRGCF